MGKCPCRRPQPGLTPGLDDGLASGPVDPHDLLLGRVYAAGENAGFYRRVIPRGTHDRAGVDAGRTCREHAPAGIVPADAEAALRGVGAVVDVHDLHLWTLTSGMHVATVHLVCDDGADPTTVLTEAAAVLRERFAIDHATIQVEPRSAHACVETSW